MKQAVVFDMDGVISDSEPFYTEAINVVLEPYGVRMTDAEHEAIIGSSIDDTWRFVIAHFKLKGTLADWKAPYDRAVVDVLSRKVKPSPGLYMLLERLAQRQIKLAVATSSQLNWARTILGKLEVERYFPIVVTTEMVLNAKPAPDLYLLATKRLGVAPTASLAIEDSPRGLGSAKAAGLTAIAVRTPSTAGMDISIADHVINSLEEFDLQWLE